MECSGREEREAVGLEEHEILPEINRVQMLVQCKENTTFVHSIYIFRVTNFSKAKIVAKKEEFVCGKKKMASSCDYHKHKTIKTRRPLEKNEKVFWFFSMKKSKWYIYEEPNFF